MIITISIYNKNTGQIAKIINCIDSDVALQYDSSNEFFIQGMYADNKYYIENNQAILIPPSPNQYCVFNYDTKQWIDPRTNETQWLVVKGQRNSLLAESDWTQMPDVSITNKDQWATYRQQLRDITTQTDPFNIIWPSKPE